MNAKLSPIDVCREDTHCMHFNNLRDRNEVCCRCDVGDECDRAKAQTARVQAAWDADNDDTPDFTDTPAMCDVCLEAGIMQRQAVLRVTMLDTDSLDAISDWCAEHARDLHQTFLTADWEPGTRWEIEVLPR